VWQVYVEAEANSAPGLITSDSSVSVIATGIRCRFRQWSHENDIGSGITNRFNGYRAAQINGAIAPGYSSGQARHALEEVFAQTMPREMGYDYQGMSFQEQVAEKGVSVTAIFGFSLLFCVSDSAALYESWSLPSRFC